MELKFKKAFNYFTEIRHKVSIYKDLWFEGTTALLHAPRETDKTRTALEIAASVASSNRDVLYINAKEYLNDYSDIVTDTDNLYVYTPEYESTEDDRDYAELVFEAIKNAVERTSIHTFVIDSITSIAALSFGKNASPSFVMKRLVAMKAKYRLSILVVADDISKTATKPLVALAATDFTVQEEKATEIIKDKQSADFSSASQIIDNQKDEYQLSDCPTDDYLFFDQLKDETPGASQSKVSSSLSNDGQENRRERRFRRRHRKQQARQQQRNATAEVN